MKQRTPQLSLRLETGIADSAAPWCADRAIAYLGTTLTLVLSTTCRLPERMGQTLHLPLPPAATPRQIRDAAESWLRDEALRIFAEKSALAGRPLRIVLSFGKHGDWARIEDNILRCHWRLIEQPLAVIAQVIDNAITIHTSAPRCDDLFALA